MAEALANMMFKSASASIQKGTLGVKDQIDIQNNAATLALKKEQMQLKMQQNKQAQQQLVAKGLDNVIKSYSTLDKFKDQSQANKLRKNMLPVLIQANGVSEALPPHIQDAMMVSPEVRFGQGIIAEKARKGEITGAQALLALQDLDATLDFANIAKAAEFNLSETGKAARSKDQITAAGIKTDKAIAAKAEAKALEFDQLPATERIKKVNAAKVAFEDKGGFAKSETNIKLAKKVLEKLKTNKLKTGTNKLKILLNIPLTDQMNVLRTLDSDLALAVDEMQSVVNVKGALDSQFSDMMAIRVFSRIIDPLASNEANITRIKTFITQQQKEDESKRRLFNSINQPQRQSEAQAKPGETHIDDATVQRLGPIYNQLINSGQSPEEVFQLLKKQVGGSDAQINQLIKKFQIEGR